jgi:dCMP deaminase
MGSLSETATLDKWPRRYLEMARHVSDWSKDPSTKVGAVLVSPDGGTITPGYNGFPRRVIDDPARLHDRETKLAMTLHAEENAILNLPVRPEGYTLYVWPMPPCSHCAAMVIQSGIIKVVAPEPGDRWAQSCRLGRMMMWEAGLEVEWINL